MKIKLYIVFFLFISACNTSGSRPAKSNISKNSITHDSIHTKLLIEENSTEHIDEEKAEEDTIVIDTAACGLKFTAGKNKG